MHVDAGDGALGAGAREGLAGVGWPDGDVRQREARHAGGDLGGPLGFDLDAEETRVGGDLGAAKDAHAAAEADVELEQPGPGGDGAEVDGAFGRGAVRAGRSAARRRGAAERRPADARRLACPATWRRGEGPSTGPSTGMASRCTRARVIRGGQPRAVGGVGVGDGAGDGLFELGEHGHPASPMAWATWRLGA